jgi:hypothetical protein
MCLDWPQILVLLFSGSQVARLIGVSHWHSVLFCFVLSFWYKVFITFPTLASNLRPSCLHLWSSWDYNCAALYPILMKCFEYMFWNQNTPDSGMENWYIAPT